jgi:membrane protease YdiL (CAAX protease family)
MTHILTPDVQAYLRAAVVVGGAGGVAIASHIHVRWLDRYGCPGVVVHAVVFVVLAVAGVAVVGFRALAHTGWAGAAAGVVGLPVGLAVAFADVWLARRLTRRHRQAGSRATPRAAAASRIRSSAVARSLTGDAGYGPGSATWTPTGRDSAVPTKLGWLLIAAVAEECVFRGVLTTAVLGISWLPGRLAGLAAVIALFCLSHLYFGWAQVAAKAPLSVLATILVLATGAIIGAVLVHVVVNARVWRVARQQGPAVPDGGGP